MGIYVTADIHGNPFSRFSTDAFYEQKEFSKNKDENVCIILGDFGIVWQNDGESPEEKWKLDWLENKNFTTVFVDGNHDNHPRIYTYPVKEWNGGLVHEIRKHVLHLIRGEVYTIQGKKFFAFGGASSHDIQDGILDRKDFQSDAELVDEYRTRTLRGEMIRVNHMSWWAEEMPSHEEMDFGLSTLAEHDNQVDFVLTHCCPHEIESIFSCGDFEPDELTAYFDAVKNSIDFTKWFFGHYHGNTQILDKFVMLYDQIVRVI